MAEIGFSSRLARERRVCGARCMLEARPAREGAVCGARSIAVTPPESGLPDIRPFFRREVEEVVAVDVVEVVPHIGVHHDTVDTQACERVDI